MIPRISVSTVRVKPTDRKIKKSVCAAQKSAVAMKNKTPIESRGSITELANVLSYVKNTLVKRGN